MSHFYDLLAGSSEWRLIHSGLKELAINPGETVLEIGCGTGKALAELCQQAGESGVIVGLDLSPGMLRMANNRLAKMHLPKKRALLLVGDSVHLPYADDVFSALFMSFTLELFEPSEIAIVLAECWRVLKPAGRMEVVAMEKPVKPKWIDRLYEWSHEHFPTYIDCRPIDAKTIIRAAGFSIDQAQVMKLWGLPVIRLLARKSYPQSWIPS